MRPMPEKISTVVIGGGQAGLSVGYFLKQHDIPFVILDAEGRVGDSWRKRWDSLRLFTPAWLDGLAGLEFPGDPRHFPSKDEMADYLERYADEFELPVFNNTQVVRLSSSEAGFVVETTMDSIRSDNVVVAMSSWQRPRIPEFASELRDEINQLHSSEYRSPAQMHEGDPVLVVGAGNSGAEIALELTRAHRVILSGIEPGHVPVDIETALGRLVVRVVNRLVFHRLLTVRTPMGRRIRAKKIKSGEPLVRTKPKDLERAGVERTQRVVGVKDGWPELEDGTVLKPANIVWSTGYRPGQQWIDLPVFDDDGVVHQSGIVETVPGLYFVGLKFLYSISSGQIHGVGRDAERIARAVARRTGRTGTSLSSAVATGEPA